MLEYNDHDDAPPIVVNLYDSDPQMFGASLFGGDKDPTDTDDFIGRALIFMD
jgi:hypothetical protein